MSASNSESWDIVVVGGGIVGLAVAHELASSRAGRVLVLEKEPKVGMHQTGRNSGVLHAGLYYKPGSLKATTCRLGKAMMEAFCEQEKLPWERCGKVVVATREEELPRLQALAERGRANGVEFTEIDERQIRELEPYAAGIAGLHVTETGITDYATISRRLAERIGMFEGSVQTQRGLMGIKTVGSSLALQTTQGTVACDHLINCAGLHCDRVYQMCGGQSQVRIVPFRGEYYELRPEKHHLVRNLIYPVPDPAFPFLGVHFTRMVLGGVECGPNAVLALAREGYNWTTIRPTELWQTLTYAGFRKLALKYLKTGTAESLAIIEQGGVCQSVAAIDPFDSISRFACGSRGRSCPSDRRRWNFS